jgi:hypothetical protein
MSKQSQREKRAKPAKPVVKVPKSKLGRTVFVGSQIFGALAIARSIRDARATSDRLAQLHGALNAATLIVTALIAVRNVRAANAEKTTAHASAEPLLLALAER